MDAAKNTTAINPAAIRNAQEVEFAKRMKDLESDLNDVVHMSFLVSDKLEDFGNEEGAHGEDIISFQDGERDALCFAIYEVDRRLRRLRQAYYAAYEVFHSDSSVGDKGGV